MAAVTPIAPVREGYNSYTAAGQPFHVSNRYVVQRVIGQGAYGVVWYATRMHT